MQFVIPHLIRCGHEVVGVDNFARYGVIERDRDYTFIQGDLTDPTFVDEIMQDIDGVIQAAALIYGVGGFHKGLAEAGFEFNWVGFSDIDKYSNGVYKYNYKEAVELGDIRFIQPERDLPNIINILTSGFPCQSFSQAGRRKGFKDTRGTLFFEIARILRYYVRAEKPIDCFLLENVKGLLSHDNGRTFAIIYRVLTDIGYTVECQLFNTSIILYFKSF